MTEEKLDELLECCDLLGSKSMHERATAAREATDLIYEAGYTWAKVLGAKRPKAAGTEIPRDHKYNGFIPFAESSQSTYDEARGYSILMATSEEKILLTKIMQKEAPLHHLDDAQHKLMQHLRDEARSLRDLFVGQKFKIKSGRFCRVVSSQP